MRDLKQALRKLTASPGFSVVAVLTLALGVAACAAIFSVVNGVLLRPLPYVEPDRLVTLAETKLPEFPEFPVAPGNFFDWQRQSASFESMAALHQGSFNLTGAGEPIRVAAAQITANALPTLGATPLLGRAFTAEEDVPGRGQVAILSHGFWLRQFGGRPEVLHQTLQLDDRPFTIVGIMAKGFDLGGAIDVFTPASFSPAARQNRGAHVIDVFGRIKRGASLAQVRNEMNGIAAGLAARYPGTNQGWGVKVTPMLEAKVGDVRRLLWSLQGAVAFLLLIACANVANLLLARATGRSKEIAIRAALGATRWRLVRQLLTESVVLALVAGALGLYLAHVGVRALVALAPETLPRVAEIGVDRRVFAFTFGLTLLTGVAFGLVPAFQTTRIALHQTLKASGRGTSTGGSGHRLRGMLVVAEVAFALVLLAGAGLLIRSFAYLAQVNPGFHPQGAVAVNLSLAPKKYRSKPQQAAFADQVVERLAALPGVQTVGAAQVLPLSGDSYVYDFKVAGRPMDASITTGYAAVAPDYFKAMGIPLLSGRAFQRQDSENRPPVAIINQTMARKFFPGENPLGKRLSIDNGPESWREVVGVVGDVKHDGLGEEVPLQTYEPLAQHPSTALSFVVRVGDAAMSTGLVSGIRTAVHAVDGEQPIASIRPLGEYVVRSTARQRFSMLLFGVFAAVALLLAAVGVYGVMAYAVSQRTGEIGIRMALGSPPSRVLGLVFAEGGRLILAGVAIGLAGALALTRFLAPMLYRVGKYNPVTFVAIAGLLCLIAALACLLPARHATRVEPITALRNNAV